MSDARRVCLDDADDACQVLCRHTAAAPDAGRRTVRAGDVRIGAVIDVEQTALRRLEQNALPLSQSVVQQRRRIGDVRLHLGHAREVFLAQHVGVELLGTGRQAAQHAIFALDDGVQAFSQMIGIE